MLRFIGSEHPVITKQFLLKAGLIKNKSMDVKVLGDGTINKPVTLQGLSVSKSAKTKIEAAGGKIL